MHNCLQWEDVGRTTLVEHEINTGDDRPIAQRQYQIPSIAKESLIE